MQKIWCWHLSSNVFNNAAYEIKATHSRYWSSSYCVQQNMTKKTVSTVDNDNVALFSKEMHEWWKPNGTLNLLHSFNTVRIPYLKNGIANGNLEVLKDKSILDVGCGGDIMSEELAKLGATVTGIDVSKELISVAQDRRNCNSVITYEHPSYYNVSIEDHAEQYTDHYDVVVASEVIEFVNNLDLFVKSCVQVLKPGGRIFFTAPNRTRMSQFVIIFMCENMLKNTLKGIHQYEKFVKPQELTSILNRNNCNMESTCGLLYNPVNNKWQLSKYHGIMYLLIARKLCQECT